MRVGFKLYSSNLRYAKLLKFADFLEVLPLPGDKKIRGFREYSYDYAIHAAHNSFGFNPANLKNEKMNKQIISEAIEAADMLGAKRIVVHPGFTNSKEKIRNGMENCLTFFEDNYDKRFHFENIIHKEEGNVFFGYTIDDTKKFLKKMKFCLDFGHAINAALKEKQDYKKFVLRLYALKPNYFHLCGNIIRKKYLPESSHLSIFSGNDDTSFYKELIRKAKKDVCLETPLDIRQREKEYEFMKA